MNESPSRGEPSHLRSKTILRGRSKIPTKVGCPSTMHFEVRSFTVFGKIWKNFLDGSDLEIFSTKNVIKGGAYPIFPLFPLSVPEKWSPYKKWFHFLFLSDETNPDFFLLFVFPSRCWYFWQMIYRSTRYLRKWNCSSSWKWTRRRFSAIAAHTPMKFRGLLRTKTFSTCPWRPTDTAWSTPALKTTVCQPST